MTGRHRIPPLIDAPTGHAAGALLPDPTDTPGDPAAGAPAPGDQDGKYRDVRNVAPFFEGAAGGRANGPIIRNATAPRGHL